MANLSAMSLLANAKYNQLAEMYGDDPAKWKLSGAATLIGADIAEGYSQWAQNSLQAASIEKRQNEISRRADVSIANLFNQGEQIASKQASAFIKSGVKLEGSALSVMSETMEQATEAARIRRMEADFEIGQMEVEKALAKTRAKLAPFQTAINIAGSAVSSGIFSHSPVSVSGAGGTTAAQQAELKQTLGPALMQFSTIN